MTGVQTCALPICKKEKVSYQAIGKRRDKILEKRKDPIFAYGFLFRGAFGSLPSIGETIVKVTPLIFTGLAAVFSYQCGMLNLGIEGQFIAGAIAANWLSTIVLPFTGAANMILSLIGGMAAGAVWGAIPGLLKAFWKRKFCE